MIVKLLPPQTTLGQDEWQVWVQLEDGHPLTANESFIVGLGNTPHEAQKDALSTFEEAVDALAILVEQAS